MQERLLGRLRKMINGSSRPPKETMLIIFLSGILIFVILLPTGNETGSYQSKRNQSSENSLVSDSSSGTGYESIKVGETAVNEYKRGLERELEEFLSSVAGVGEVKVLIYMKNSQEYIVEKDQPTTSSVNGESSDATKDETTVYTVNGNGDEVPFVSQTKSPAIDGVVVAAKGAANETVRVQIVRLVMALYGVEANKVEVFAMG